MGIITTVRVPQENQVFIEIHVSQNGLIKHFFDLTLTKQETESLVKKLLSALAMVPEDQRNNYVQKAR